MARDVWVALLPATMKAVWGASTRLVDLLLTTTER